MSDEYQALRWNYQVAMAKIAKLEREREAERPSSLRIADVEQWAVRQAMARARGNKREAARILGIGKGTLYRRLGEMTVAGVSFYEKARADR